MAIHQRGQRRQGCKRSSRQMRMRLTLLVTATLAVLANQPAYAESCVGDCDNNGQVTVSELIRSVNIALGVLPIENCMETDVDANGRVTIEELISSVNNALCGCGEACPRQTPAPGLSPSLTPTPTPTATATATPGIPNVAGSWREDDYRLVGSDCLDEFTQQLVTELSGEICDYQISQTGSALVATDCDGIRFSGTIDINGAAHLEASQNEVDDGCRMTLDAEIIVDLSHSQSDALLAGVVEFSGACGPLFDCTLSFESRWTRL